MTSLGIARVPRRPRIGRPRSAAEPPPAAGPAPWIDSAVTASQLWGAADGVPWITDVYLPVLSRRTAVSYAIVHRCVSLLGGIVARLVVDTVHVVDRERRQVRSRRAAALVDVLRESIDGVAPAAATIEDVVADYALDGNAFLLPVLADGQLRRLERLASPGASGGGAMLSRLGTWTYQLTPIRSLGEMVRVDEREVVHVRWPRMGWRGATSGRDAVAEAPIRVLRPAIAAGIEADAYVLDWYRRARRSRLHVDYEMSDLRPEITEAQMKTTRKHLEEAWAAGRPTISHGGTVTQVGDAGDEKAGIAARDQQLADVARFYGLPAPIAGMNLTSWGSGIEELSRLGWRYGISQHMARFLAPISARCLPRGQALAVDPHWLVQGDTRAIRELIETLDHPQRDPLATPAELRRLAGLMTLDQAGLDSLQRHGPRRIDLAPEPEPPGPPEPGAEPGPGPPGAAEE